MNTEIKKILKMLEEGKISAEEAKDLIDAVGIENEDEKFNSKSKWTENISDSISSLVGESFSWLKDGGKGGLNDEYSCEDIETLNLKSFAGDISIERSNDTYLRIDNAADIKGKVKKSVGAIDMKSYNSNIDLQIPKNIKTINISQMGGDLTGKIISQNINIKSKGGDLDIIVSNLNSLKMDSMGGDIILRIPEDFDGKFHVNNLGGDFSSDISYKEIKKGGKHLIGKFGLGENADIKINSLGGDIEFKKI